MRALIIPHTDPPYFESVDDSLRGGTFERHRFVGTPPALFDPRDPPVVKIVRFAWTMTFIRGEEILFDIFEEVK